MTVYSDTEFTIEVGNGIVFGPYGPGRCESVHPTAGVQCVHHNRHVGCHTSEDGDEKMPTWRWA